MNTLHQSLRSTFAGLLATSLAFGVLLLLPANALAQSSGLTQAQLANAAYCCPTVEQMLRFQL